MTWRNFKKNAVIVSFFLMVLSLSALYSRETLPVSGREGSVIPGVVLHGHKLGNFGYTEFSGVIAACGASLAKQAVILHVDEASPELITTYREMGVFPDSERIWQEAISVGQTGGGWEKLWTKWQVKHKGYEVPLYLHINKEQAEITIRKLTSPWRIEPKDARILISNDDKISISEDTWGSDVNLDAFWIELEKEILEKPGEPLTLNLSFISVRPRQTKSDIEAYHITGRICTFSTSFNPQRLNRTKNIALAAVDVNDCLLAPGEIFSFNKVVGPRTKERGYDEADIIMRNELVSGIGGGVCQVSSTLYNAGLLAGLEIVERYNHSMMISYVRPGLDATVSYGSKDLKFRNNSGGHLIIKCTVRGNNLSVKIFGWARQKGRIVLKCEIEREIAPKTIYHEDPSVPEGKYILERHGEPGYVVKVERCYYDEKGKLLNTDLLHRDYYPPVDRILKTLSGTASLPPEVTSSDSSIPGQHTGQQLLSLSNPDNL